MNNKGFAFSTMLYGFMIIGCLIFLIILGLMSTNRTNTREMVNQIEDESARLSLASKTFTTHESGKAYRDYDVPLGFGGWYKIELWSNSKYSATTINLKELTVVRFFIGSSNTYACSSNIYNGTINTSYTSESQAESAYTHLEITDILTTSDCTSGGNQALILSTSGTGSKNIKQLGDGITKNTDGSFSILNFGIDARDSGRRNTVTGIDSSGTKARITYVSPETILSTGPTGASDVCKKGHSGVYYIKSGSNFWNNTSSSTGAFTGNKNQKWLIQCNNASSPTCTATNIYSFSKVNSFSCSGKTFYNAGY